MRTFFAVDVCLHVILWVNGNWMGQLQFCFFIYVNYKFGLLTGHFSSNLEYCFCSNFCMIMIDDVMSIAATSFVSRTSVRSVKGFHLWYTISSLLSVIWSVNPETGCCLLRTIYLRIFFIPRGSKGRINISPIVLFLCNVWHLVPSPAVRLSPSYAR